MTRPGQPRQAATRGPLRNDRTVSPAASRSTAAVLAALATLAAPLVCRAGAAPGRFPVGVMTRTFTKTSVSTGAPRPLETIVWYPAGPTTGTPEALGLREATVRRGRWPLVVFSHGACGRPEAASYLTMALAADGFVVAARFPLCGTLAEDEGHRLVLRYALPFFRRYLKNRRGASRALVLPVAGVELTAEPRRRSRRAP